MKITNFFSRSKGQPVAVVEEKVQNEDQAKRISETIFPTKLSRIRQDAQSWREAIDEAERSFNPYRVLMQQIYIDTVLDGHVKSCVERRRDLTGLREWQIVNGSGETLPELEKLLRKKWFSRYIKYSLDAVFFGYSLIELGDVVNNEFPKIKIVKRWNVSPDRHVVSSLMYGLHGVNFLEEPVSDWNVWISTDNEIGSSQCGFGILYEVALYQIFLRNLLGYNGDFLEIFGQPLRVGKTSKIEPTERAEFAEMLSNMGSAGWVLMDAMEDQIDLIEARNVGASFQAFDNFEARLQKLISKIILGHADALDSIPGKLGSSKEESPAENALRDKQAKDGIFVCEAVNGELFPRLRKLGFSIPEDARFEFKNNKEKQDNNNAIADVAVKIKNAGLQMDKTYFEEQTGIKLSDVPAPPIQEPNKTEPEEEEQPKKTVKEQIRNLYKS